MINNELLKKIETIENDEMRNTIVYLLEEIIKGTDTTNLKSLLKSRVRSIIQEGDEVL